MNANGLCIRRAPSRWGIIGFTLVELLVVVTVLAVLTLLGLGVAGSASRSTIITGDVSNLRAIGVALSQYIAEHRNELPPVMGPKVPNYAQEYLAAQMGMNVSFRDPTIPRARLGVWISPGDKAKPPGLSALRSYSVNYYMVFINGATDGRIARTIFDVKSPASKLYMVPSEGGENSSKDSQARFSEGSYPFVPNSGFSMRLRFDSSGKTAALWVDGHASVLTLEAVRAQGTRLLFPK